MLLLDSTLPATAAQQVWGEPNKRLSTRHEPRFGTNGARSVDLEKLTWFDNEANEGGSYVGLRKNANGHTKPRANGHPPSQETAAPRSPGRIVATYDYRDEQGERLFQVVRSEEANEDMGLNAVLSLVPDRTHVQLTVLDPKGGLGLSELNVGLPELFVAPIADIRAQEIGRPGELGTGVKRGVAGDAEAESCGAGIGFQRDGEAGGGTLVARESMVSPATEPINDATRSPVRLTACLAVS